MLKPKQLDPNGEECLLVIQTDKTGVTIGRGTGLESFVYVYSRYGIKSTSREVAINPYSHKGGLLSAPRDSGSIVVDREGHIVGLFTGGAGTTDSTDVTYITCYDCLNGRINAAFPNSHLHPIE